MTTVVVVTVGTDHHPFDRLVTWMEAWAGMHGSTVRCVVQYGSSRAPLALEGFGVLPRPELLDLLRTAHVVVSQGGPGSIRDARGCGLVPIVVPRRADLGEVVDDHQGPFCHLLQESHQCLVAETRDQLFALLAGALADPHTLRRPPDASPAAATAAHVSRLVLELQTRPAGFVSVRRLRHLLPQRDPG